EIGSDNRIRSIGFFVLWGFVVRRIDCKKSDDELAECKIYWRCETYKNGCKGRGNSFGLNGPLKVTISHNHILNPEKKEFLQSKEKLKSMAVSANEAPHAIRQQIIQTRNTESGYGSNAKCLTDLVIPECLQITHKNVKFYYGDSVVKFTGVIFIYANHFGVEFKLKALAFLPEADVLTGFEQVKVFAPAKGKRVVPRFPIDIWNLHERVKLGLPHACKNMTVKKAIEFFRLEQNNMETDLLILFSGETIKQTRKKDLVREQKLKTIVSEYDVLNIDLFLNGIIGLLDDQL
ncbi:hypothetical protein BpHYR1_012687, partial [Brachionus plicatilis]